MEHAFHQRYRDQGLVVVGIGSGGFNETDALLHEFREQTGVTFPIAWDGGSLDEFAFPDAFWPFPRHVVLDRDGTIVHLAVENHPDILAEAIEAVLASP